MNSAAHKDQFEEGQTQSAQKTLSPTEDAAKEAAAAYWRANLRLLAKLLAVWFIVSFGFGILLVEPLNTVSFLGVKLGFWFAQQGSIYVFVALIFIYALQMKKLERQFGVDD